MQELNLADVDLNLLVSLDALLSEGSVTRAAERLRVSQPAMSRTLARLRQLFDDELLVRGRREMVLTTRAETLRQPIRRALTAVEAALSDHLPFDPATSHRSFGLAITDHGEISVLPGLCALLAAEAPEVDLHVAYSGGDPEESLETGATDLFIGAFIRELPGLFASKLFDDDFVCLVRRGHPVLADEMTIERYADLRHVLVTPRGTRDPGQVDVALASQGLHRRITLRTPRFLSAALVVARSDLAIAVPSRIARALADGNLVVEIPLPLAVPPFSLHQVWHERSAGDPAHQWLRRRVAASIRSRTDD